MNILAKVQRPRHRFDPSNKKHVEVYRLFLVDHRWDGGCPFELEWPYLSIPDMIKDKVIHHFLKIE